MATRSLLALALLAQLALSAPLHSKPASLPSISHVARIEWAAASSDSYDPATGGGQWASRAAKIHKGDHVCGDVVSMLAKIDMAAGFEGTQTVHFMPTFEGLGDDAVIGAVLNVDDSETKLHEGHTPTVGLEKKAGEVFITVVGLKENEHVVVRVDATVDCVVGNGLAMQSKLADAQVQAPGAEKTVLSEKTVSRKTITMVFKALEQKGAPVSINAVSRMQVDGKIRTDASKDGSKNDGSKDGSKKDGSKDDSKKDGSKDGSKKDNSKDGSKKDGSKDKSGNDKGYCGCRLLPSSGGGKCLDFLGPIAGKDNLFKCEMRSCGSGKAWRCVESGATDKCDIKTTNSKALNFLYYDGDHGVCNQVSRVGISVKPKDGSKKDGSKKDGSKKDGSKKDGSEKDGSKDGSKDDSKKDGSKDGSKKDGSKKDGSKKDGSKKD